MKILDSLENIDKFVMENKIALLYFTSQNCSVCVALLPKIKEFLKKYSNIANAKVEINEVQLAVGKYSIFTAPTIIMFIEGKEVIRESRFISIIELQEKIRRLINFI